MTPSTASALRRLLESLDARPRIVDLSSPTGEMAHHARELQMDYARWLHVSDDTAQALRDLDVSGALLELDALVGGP